MTYRNRALPAPAPITLAKAGATYGVVLLASVLCACTASSSWKASSAASTSRVAKAKATDAPYEREEVNYATPSSSGDAADSGAAPQRAQVSDGASSAAASATLGDEGGMQSAPVQGHAGAQGATQDGAAGASSQFQFEEHAADDAHDVNTGDFPAPGGGATDRAAKTGGSTGAGAQARSQAGAQSGDAAQASTVSRTGDASSGAGAAGAVAGAHDSGAGSARAGDETGAGRGDSDTEAAAAGKRGSSAAALDDDSAAGGAGTAGTSGSLDSGTAGAGANGAGASTSGAAGARNGAGGAQADGAGVQGDGAGAQDPVMVGVVEAPGKKATRNEEVIPLTLGGLLPMTLGVDGQGEFDFDAAVLRDQVKELLDMLVTRLKGAEYDRIEIVGHTDRIGAADYNQYLSERRAWAVARYLAKQGVPVSKMQVEGRGMHEPATGAHECDVAGNNRDQLIACLQKDRRVVISASIRKVDVNVQ